MSEIKVNSIKGVGASAAAITVNNTDGTCTANITNNLSNRNLIINGAMQVAQRGTSSTGLGASSGYFTLDRYRTTFSNTAGRVTMAQVTDVHDGFANAMKFTCTTEDTSIANDEYFILQHKIEGQDLQQLKKGSSDAEEFTVSFYVKGNASATYVVEIYDLDNNRQISKTFSVTTGWTRVELTFPADTTGTLDDDTAASLQLGIWLHAGSNYTSGTLNSSAFAANASAQRAGGISSFFDSTNRTFFLTGLQLEVGSVATDFEHRSFGDELARCQRYFFAIPYGSSSNNTQFISSIDTFARSATELGAQVHFPVPMRQSASYTGSATNIQFNTADSSDYFNANQFSNYLTISGEGSCGMSLRNTGAASMTAGQSGHLIFRATGGFLQFSAEL